MKGLIFSVKRYSVHDGPGIRVTLFLKGCPLNCIWCHNPEGISPIPETVMKCTRIGEREFFKEEQAGEYYSVDSVLELLGKEKVFMDHSEGGVTFSGGEPMLQFDFLLEVLKECKANGYHTAVDTSGHTAAEKFVAIMQYTDLFLFDLKHLDPLQHIKATGVSNELILENLGLLVQNRKDIIIRIPVIPGFNDDEVYISTLRKFLMNYGTNAIKKICILPFHKIGASKYKRFNIKYKMEGIEPPDRAALQKLKEYLMETGIPVKIGG